MTPRRLRSVAFVASAVIIASASSGCAPVSVTTGPAPTVGSEQWSGTEWWAVGDSLFAGHDSVPGAPTHLRGVLNASAGGTTLVPVTTLGNQHGDLVTQISTAIDRYGRPHHVVISAGMADLYARQLWGVDLPLSTYADRYRDVTTWLQNLGVDVHWMTLTPITTSGIVGGQTSMQAMLNSWLRTSGLPIVDCESSLTAPGSPWLDESLTFPLDGVHLNEAGATRYAACISAGIGVPLVTDPPDPEPTVPDTSVPDTSVPDTSVPDSSVPESPGP